MAINSDYSSKANPQSTGKKSTIYSREHVYELQMRTYYALCVLRHNMLTWTGDLIIVSLFINNLATNVHTLWDSGGTNFCSWAKTYLATPYFPLGGSGLSVTASLQRCLPASSAASTDLGSPEGNRMVWLENIAVSVPSHIPVLVIYSSS